MARFSKRHLLTTFLMGAGVGAGFALLYAPKSGSQTRRDLRRFSQKAADQFDDFQEDVRNQVSEGYEQVLGVLDNVKEYVEDGKNRLQKLMRSA